MYDDMLFDTEEEAEKYAYDSNLYDYEIRWSQAYNAYYIYTF